MNLSIILFLSLFIMTGCSSIEYEDYVYDDCEEYGDCDEYGKAKAVELKQFKEVKQIKLSDEEKITLEKISNEYGKCAAYYKYAILLATTTDATPLENIDEVGEKQTLSVNYAVSLAIQLLGMQQGRVLVMKNYMNEYRNNLSIQNPGELELLKKERRKECSFALSKPEGFARSKLSSSESDAKLKLRLSDIFNRIEVNSL